MKRFAEILCLVMTISGGVYGAVAHKTYGAGFFICGIIGAGLGLVAALMLYLFSAVVISVVCDPGIHRPKK